MIGVAQEAEELFWKKTLHCAVSYCVHFVARIVVSGREHTELVLGQVILYVCVLKS